MRIPLLFLYIVVSIAAHAQSALTGTVHGKNNLTLVGATVLLDSSNATYTDGNGVYKLMTTDGIHRLRVINVGYERYDTLLNTVGNITLNVRLHASGHELDLVVVSASRYEKRLAEETVSMSVIKPQFIESANSVTVDEAVNRVPGINIVDGQANIRGGSGYSYGAGSRVLVLVDDVPQLTGDASDVKWDFLPIENTGQIEIVKGAASTLYGSSAVNGVINLRTAYPGLKPATEISVYQGLYGNPDRSALKWWSNQQPLFNGVTVSHKRKIGRLDVVTGLNLYNEQSFLQYIFEQRARLNVNLRYRFKRIEGLSVGINSNAFIGRSNTFFLWQDDSTGAYKPLGGIDSGSTINHMRAWRFNLDPYVNYVSKSGMRQSLRGHALHNDSPTDEANQSTRSTVYYGEYQITVPFKFGLHATGGLVANALNVTSDLYGNHHGNNEAAYAQLDYKIWRLDLTGGVRYETYKVDSATGTSPPVFRAGLNFELFRYTHLRASFGQGYRFPSVAEKYVKTNSGSLYVYPNPQLQSETSTSAEVGLQQGFRLGGVNGYVDVAAFEQRLDHFMEFTFGPWGNPLHDPLSGLGFRSENVNRAIIKGIEANVYASGKIGASELDVITGFTYINPIDVSGKQHSDSVLTFHHDLKSPVRDSVYNLRYLKYRYTTTFKFDADWTWKRLSLGSGCRYNSYMIRVDPFLVLINGIYHYRQTHHHGDLVFDARVGWQFTNMLKLSFVVKNITNAEYTDRPARLNPPRNYTLLLTARF